MSSQYYEIRPLFPQWRQGGGKRSGQKTKENSQFTLRKALLHSKSVERHDFFSLIEHSCLAYSYLYRMSPDYASLFCQQLLKGSLFPFSSAGRYCFLYQSHELLSRSVRQALSIFCNANRKCIWLDQRFLQ